MPRIRRDRNLPVRIFLFASHHIRRRERNTFQDQAAVDDDYNDDDHQHAGVLYKRAQEGCLRKENGHLPGGFRI